MGGGGVYRLVNVGIFLYNFWVVCFLGSSCFRGMEEFGGRSSGMGVIG